MLNLVLHKLRHHFQKPEVGLTPSLVNYAKNTYPSNHSYYLYNQQLIPSRKLVKRYRVIKQYYPHSLTSLLDIGSSKGFFVFSAIKEFGAKKALGIDLFEDDVHFCNRLNTEYLHENHARFEVMRLHELAERIDEFGGPFQIVLVINIYQYLYFGSDRASDAYYDHDMIFNALKKICSERVIFSNRICLSDIQNKDRAQLAQDKAVNYTEEKIKQAASRYFKVSERGMIGRYPIWTLDI